MLPMVSLTQSALRRSPVTSRHLTRPVCVKMFVRFFRCRMCETIVQPFAMDTNTTLFDRLGGIRKTAELLGEAPSTVQSWKAAGRIPAQKQPLVLERAAAVGIEISAEDVVYPLGKPVAEAPT